MGCNCGGNHLTESDCPSTTTDPCGQRTDGSGASGTATKPLTYCDRDTKDNVWVERADWSPEAPDICLLDTMSECQVIDVISRQARARADLLRVTSDPHLLYLAATVPRLGDVEEDDALQDDLNRNEEPESIPFYGIFKGQPPFAQ